MTTLETDRLLLRPFRETDLAEYREILNDPESRRFLVDQEWSEEQAWRSIATILGHWQLRGYGLWAAQEKASGRLVGRIGLIRPAGWPGLEVGWLVAPWGRGSGFATEGGRAAIAFAFETLGASHLISLIDPANGASRRVAEKLGESFERQVELHGKTLDVYGIGAPA
ncbi:MAG: GNAT family N-acetyltransferase [Acidobacteriota bacterium]